MARLFPDRLRQRARTNGAAPLLTYYDLDNQERTELSGTSFLNWVDKASNLLTEELLLSPGAVVDLRLARTAPLHWVTLVLEAACWQVGAVVDVQAPSSADLVVLGPDWAAYEPGGPAVQVLACSLHPLGLGFAAALPSGALDFALEVRAQPDIYLPEPRAAADPAWVDGRGRQRHSDLVSADGGRGRRRLVRTSDPWTAALEALVLPVLSGGSAVAVVGDDPDRLVRIVETERVEPPS